MEFILAFIKDQGIGGLAILLIVLQQFGILDKAKKTIFRENYPHKRKDDDGTHHHNRDDDSKLLRDYVQKAEEHYKKEALEDIVIAKIQSDISHMREKQDDMKETFGKLFDKFEESQRDMFKIIGDVKTHLMK